MKEKIKIIPFVIPGLHARRSSGEGGTWNLYKSLFVLLVVLSSFFLLAKNVKAGEIDDSFGCAPNTPEGNAICVKQLGPGWTCEKDQSGNAFCIHKSPKAVLPPSELENYQITKNEAEKAKEFPLEGLVSKNVQFIANELSGMIVGEYDWKKIRSGEKNAMIPIKVGAIGMTSGLVSSLLSNPPVRTSEYVADISRNLGLAKPAYAQGVGFNGLKNLLPLWKIIRNFSYIIFVFAFIYIGFAIMFKVKIDAKSAVTIQSAIPKMVIALILITFSYAIVGLLIDISYLLMYLVLYSFKGLSGVTSPDFFTNMGFAKAFTFMFGEGFEVIGGTAAGLGLSAVLGIAAGLITLNPVVGLVVTALPTLIIATIVLITIVKLFLSLLSCYVSIIISTLTAPLQIMMGILPGSKSGFNSWFKSIIANILVFPAVTIVFFLGDAIGKQIQGDLWTPSLLSGTSGLVTGLIGFGFLLLLPKIPEMIKSSLGVKDFGYGTAINEAIGYAKYPAALLPSQPFKDTSKRAGQLVRGFGQKFNIPVLKGRTPPVGEEAVEEKSSAQSEQEQNSAYGQPE